MSELSDALTSTVEEVSFSGVVRVDRRGETVYEAAWGDADRACGSPNTLATRFGLASGTKGLTAPTVMSLVESGELQMSTTARSLLGRDLPLIDDAVTVEHLLAHRSGIGDYLDEDTDLDLNDYLMPVPVHELTTTEAYLSMLDGFPMKFQPGESFSYSNGGYVVLALIAERVAGIPFHDLVVQRVCEPAGMTSTEFLRSDELGEATARGYLESSGLRTNVFHLPVRGSGDGGIYSTLGDIHTFWAALFEGRILPRSRVDEMVRPLSDVPKEGKRYGLGFWLHRSSNVVMLEGIDAGVSFWTSHDPSGDLTCTVISNTTDGAWPLARVLRDVS